MTLDTKRLRDNLTEHRDRLGLRTDAIAQWRLACPPGLALMLLDEIDHLRSHYDRAAPEHTELNGHIEICEQCCDYLDHQTMDEGDPTGKLQDFVGSLRVVIDQAERSAGIASARNELADIAEGLECTLSKLGHYDGCDVDTSNVDRIAELRKVAAPEHDLLALLDLYKEREDEALERVAELESEVAAARILTQEAENECRRLRGVIAKNVIPGSWR